MTQWLGALTNVADSVEARIVPTSTRTKISIRIKTSIRIRTSPRLRASVRIR
jgi:hypothetical protein